MDSRIKYKIVSSAIEAACTCEGHKDGSVEAGFLGLAISNSIDDALLTAGPEPCEDAHEWDALTKEEMWNEIQDIRRLVDSDGTKSICSDIEDYASQVADKRSEELRAQLARANATLEEVTAQRNRAMEDVETLRYTLDFYKDAKNDDGEYKWEDKLRMSAKTALMFLKAKKDKDNLDIDMIKSFEEAIAATERKP